MSISQSMTDWAKCFIYQKKTKDKLRSTDALSFDIKRIQIEGQDSEITLNNNNASYHDSSKNAYNNRMHKRQLEKEKRIQTLKSKIF